MWEKFPWSELPDFQMWYWNKILILSHFHLKWMSSTTDLVKPSEISFKNHYHSFISRLQDFDFWFRFYSKNLKNLFISGILFSLDTWITLKAWNSFWSTSGSFSTLYTKNLWFLSISRGIYEYLFHISSNGITSSGIPIDFGAFLFSHSQLHMFTCLMNE